MTDGKEDRLYCTDLEGPVTKNDNAAELCAAIVPEGEELFRRISDGDYCHVLAERQAGKTSLAASTARKLRATGMLVAVVDLTMPGIDGIETLVRLKALDPDIQVILLTGHSTTDRDKAAVELGASDFVTKPAEFHELLDKIKDASRTRNEIVERRGGE